MKSVLLAALAALTLAAPASAQYYDERPGYGRGQRDSFEERFQRTPRYDYYDERPGYGSRSRRDDGWRDDRYYAEPRRGNRYGQAERRGSICVTSRGSCQYPQSLASGARCSCDIPGFGTKRGNIQR